MKTNQPQDSSSKFGLSIVEVQTIIQMLHLAKSINLPFETSTHDERFYLAFNPGAPKPGVQIATYTDDGAPLEKTFDSIADFATFMEV